ncbi:MAG: hypothetical protein ACT4PY_13625 [Armatimonadota bacterium]
MPGDDPQSEEPSRLVARGDTQLFTQLKTLAGQRMVFFAGLPGTGKSLLTHQLAHLAHAAGRTVHLLQWDVARPAIERSDAAARYPPRDGVSHDVIRMAAGLWARAVIVEWAAGAGSEDILIGETPFVGHRFIELARRANDAAEPLLTATECRFVIPVPSREVREFLELERERRVTHPLHAQEREDATPQVLRDLWHALAQVAQTLGITSEAAAAPGGVPSPRDPAGVPYDPLTYRRVYETVLRHRHTEIVALDTILPTGALSVYDFAVPRRDLIPTPRQAARFIRDVEARFPDLDVLGREVARWWVG